ncbi:MAG: hypothetical protein LUG18_14515 [Candidatus Azobacteroides sp.]|nr:hypothetical protein [Candidatus Azobacteroides sp.]
MRKLTTLFLSLLISGSAVFAAVQKETADPITITVDISETDWTQVAYWIGTDYLNGYFVVPSLVGEGEYTYTFTDLVWME